MNPRVLILTSIYDLSADLVACNLKERDVPFLRINREEIANIRIALDPVEPRLRVYSTGVEAEISNNLQSVWFRQPVFLRNTPGQELSISDQLEKSQWSAFLRGLSVFDARWMNWPQATYLSESKPYQLRIAGKVGFNVPKTVIGNSLVEINRAMLGDQIILKSLDTVLLREKNDCLFTYSTIANIHEWTDAEISSAPVMCQQLLRQKTDIRVTIIGDKVFAVRILEDGHGIEGDWRICARDSLVYENINLPDEIVDKCMRLMHVLGLSFGAIDLVETVDGVFFIEINPTGEWGWLCGPCRRIDEAISEWLSAPDEQE